MPSIIPGYEYDIFISYRQKDNKQDGWVTEFVNTLINELEATIKNKLNIYFDENPFDGLGETHDVDDSLAKKLKCLIFIPVISKTYCDPNSFAWTSEFLAFNELAKNDDYGFKVQLPNGNTTTRVLPIRIHELDNEDKQLLENEIGFLRSIDFVYQSAGVNRSLRANEDNPTANLNKTFYRDQINKVANSIKEIILGMQRRGTGKEPLNKWIIVREVAKLAIALYILIQFRILYFFDSVLGYLSYLGLLIFLVGLNRKWNRFLVYGGLALFLIILIVLLVLFFIAWALGELFRNWLK